MGLAKGCKPNNPAGRPTGRPNKSTEELRNIVQSFVEANIESLQNDFDALEPKDRLAFIERMFKHLLPPPLTLERLSDDDLSRMIETLKARQQPEINLSALTTDELIQRANTLRNA